MADFYENKQVTEEVILVGVALGETSVTDESLDELEELAKTAGAVTVGRLIQNREMIHPELISARVSWKNWHFSSQRPMQQVSSVMMSYHRRRWPIWRMCWISR